MAHDPYAPPARRNPAADIHDLHPKPPAFLLKQDRARLEGVAAVAHEMSDIQAREALGGYFDTAGTETTLPAETVEQLDLVAGLKLILKRLTYTEMKMVAAGLLAGEKPLTNPGEIADALEAWSSKEQAA